MSVPIEHGIAKPFDPPDILTAVAKHLK